MSRVLVLIPSLAGVGGSESLVHSLSGVLAADHQVYHASFDAPGTERNLASAIPFHAIGPGLRLPLALRPFNYLLLALRLWRLKRRLGIDVTISNLWGADLISALSLGRDKKISLGLINIRGNPTNRLMLRFRDLVGAIYRRFDRVLAICSPLALELQELYAIDPSRLGTFRNFVPTVFPRPVWPADSVKRFVFCGRMVPEKNLDALLHAWASATCGHERCQLVVLGGGDLLDQSTALARALGLNVGTEPDDQAADVLFLGMVDRAQDYMAGARAFVLPSRHEGVPTVLLLALSLGLPVMAADCLAGGVRDVLEEGALKCPEGWEEVAAGLLLPVPDQENRATMAPWTTAIGRLALDDEAHARWVAGALALSASYGEEAVRAAWTDEIKRLDPA